MSAATKKSLDAHENNNAASKIRLDLAYNGKNFRGFAENLGVRTVAGELRSALERVLRVPVELAVAGRTDAGVHATAQVVTFSIGENPTDAGVADLANRLNKMLAPEIAVTTASVVPSNFDARYCAQSRTYQYLVCNSSSCDPLQAHRQWHLTKPLDVQAMNEAAEYFIGEHDFSSFCRQTEPPKGLVRKVLHAHWSQASTRSLLEFEITARAFCQQMVRSLVGLCVSVGQARHRVDEVPEIMAAKDRNTVRRIAPPHGLTLIGVDY